MDEDDEDDVPTKVVDSEGKTVAQVIAAEDQEV